MDEQQMTPKQLQEPGEFGEPWRQQWNEQRKCYEFVDRDGTVVPQSAKVLMRVEQAINSCSGLTPSAIPGLVEASTRLATWLTIYPCECEHDHGSDTIKEGTCALCVESAPFLDALAAVKGRK
ncbi:MAG: hypothetical protein ABFE01_20685 [Phycisphaerales bacterium]